MLIKTTIDKKLNSYVIYVGDNYQHLHNTTYRGFLILFDPDLQKDVIWLTTRTAYK